MSDQQAGVAPPESYEAGMMADVRAAFEEVSQPAEAVVDKPAEPVVQDKAPDASEAKADHPTDERRYADGTFKPVAGEKPTEVKAETTPAAAKTPEVTQQQPETAQQAPVAGAPPPGWSVKSKAAWDALPDHVRADIAKREQEVSNGFAQYAGMKELQPYAEMARARGQTLKSALDRYVGIEQQLAQNPLHGLLQIAQNVGYAPQRLAAELSSMLGQPQQGTPQAFQQPGQQVDPLLMQMLSPLLNPLQQEVYGLKSLLQQQAQAAQTREVGTINSAIDRFKADPANRYFDNVEPQIVKLFEGGVVPRTGDHAADLRAAYELACRMDPEISEALFNERIGKAEADRKAQEKEAAEKAKQASRSITGSPSAGGKEIDASGDDSIEDIVRKAYRAHAA